MFGAMLCCTAFPISYSRKVTEINMIWRMWSKYSNGYPTIRQSQKKMKFDGCECNAG